MNSFADLLSNRWLWVAVLSSTAAQLLKVFLILLIERRWRPARSWRPAACPAATLPWSPRSRPASASPRGRQPLFAASAVFALIVMYDATGVRHSSGQQARLLNDLVEELRAVVREGFAPLPLRVLLGHTYLEVLVGTLLGVAAGFIAFSR